MYRVCRDDAARQLHKKGPLVNIQSWMIKSWTTHECYLPPEPDGLPRFQHANTQVRDDGSSRNGLRSGDTVWIAQNDQWLAGLAWEWVEARPGVVMLADPNSIITNLMVVDIDRQMVPSLNKIVAVNQLVHALDWQNEVRSRLEHLAPSKGAAAATTCSDSFSEPHRAAPGAPEQRPLPPRTDAAASTRFATSANTRTNTSADGTRNSAWVSGTATGAAHDSPAMRTGRTRASDQECGAGMPNDRRVLTDWRRAA